MMTNIPSMSLNEHDCSIHTNPRIYMCNLPFSIAIFHHMNAQIKRMIVDGARVNILLYNPSSLIYKLIEIFSKRNVTICRFSIFLNDEIIVVTQFFDMMNTFSK